MITISFPIDGTLVESHNILCESSCLVTKDVFNLTQLLVERGGPGLGRGVIFGIVHLPVPVDEEAVAQADNLYTVIKSQGC